MNKTAPFIEALMNAGNLDENQAKTLVRIPVKMGHLSGQSGPAIGKG